MKRYSICGVILSLIVCGSLVASSQERSGAMPRIIQYTGTLKNLDGSPRTGTFGITFAIYAEDKGTVPLWQELQNVVVDDRGHYSVLLGSSRAEGLPDFLFAGNMARWLSVHVEGEREEPRVMLVAVPYALKAADAETLGGKPLSAFVLNEKNSGGNATGGGKADAGTQTGTTTIQPLSINPSSTGTQNYLAMWTDSSGTLGDSNVSQLGSNVGIGTTTPNAPLQVGPDFTLTGAWPTMGYNLYYNGGWKYATSHSGSLIQQDYANEGFSMYTAPAGNAGDPATISRALFIGGSGNVGVGTAAPQAPLQIGSDFTLSGAWPTMGFNLYYNGGWKYATTNTGGTLLQQDYASGGLSIAVTPSGTAGAAAALTNTLFVAGSGKVGIGTTSPAEKLDVNGNINASGNMAATGTVSGSNLSATGIATFTGTPTGSDVSNGTLYINPASTTDGTQTLLGVAVGGSQKMLVDASGNLTAVGSLSGASLALPATTTSTSGVITLGGASFLHNYGNNIFLGAGAGNFTTTGARNNAVGYQALPMVTTGLSNVAFGYRALANNTTGRNNVAVGSSFAVTGILGTTFASSALESNTSGTHNTAIGNGALGTNSTGNFNVAVGENALVSNTGSNNTAIGSGALSSSQSGTTNIGIGFGAGQNLTTGSYNIYIGSVGSANESNTIRIGDGTSYKTYLAGTVLIPSGSVGINTGTPTAQLDVGGSINASGTITVNAAGNAMTATGITNGISAASITGSGASYGLSGTAASTSGTGVAGYATNSSGTTYGVYGSATSPSGYGVYSNGPAKVAGNLTVTGNVTFGATSTQLTAPRLTLPGPLFTGTGTVSVSSSSPTVTGTGTKFLTEVSVGDEIYVGATGGGGRLVTYVASDTSMVVNSPFVSTASGTYFVYPFSLAVVPFGSTGMYIAGNGGIGVGTATPDVALHVASQMDALLTDGTGAFMIGPNAGQNLLADYRGIQARNNRSTGNLFLNSLGGNVGIGSTTAPTDRLWVAGDVRLGASGTDGCVKNFSGTAIAGTCSSDSRLKKNVTTFSPMLDRVARLRPVYFDWRADEFPEYHFGAERSYGLIAQEVAEVLPELVGHDEHGMNAVNYSKLPLVMLQSIRELKTENDALRQRVQELEKLRADVEALKAAIAKLPATN